MEQAASLDTSRNTMWVKKKRYRPGIDDQPPTRLDWIIRVTGIAAIAGVVAAWFKRRRS
jgi:hypothetical protein